MIDKVIDQIAQTDEEIFSGKFCICGHLIEICHSWDDRCDALISNGAVVSTCWCRQTRVMKFEIEVIVYVNEFSAITGETTAETKKQIQLAAFTSL